MAVMLNRMVDEYNREIIDTDFKPAGRVLNETFTETECTISNFLEDTYAKYPDFFSQVIMEYNPYTDTLAQNLPNPLDKN